MGQRTDDFLKSLYDEKLKHKEYRNMFVVQKLLFTIGLSSLGSTTINSFTFDLGFLLYFVPFVALAYDMYIFAEDYKVKRVGVFIQYGSFSRCDEEKQWERWVAHNREPLAVFASFALTVLALIASAKVKLSRTVDRSFFHVWLGVSLSFTIVVFGYALLLRYKLNLASQKLIQVYKRQKKKAKIKTLEEEVQLNH